MHIAIIWQRFLLNHIARINHMNKRLSALGHHVTAIEVASKDLSYSFPENNVNDLERICCFPQTVYHQLKVRVIYKKVFDLLCSIKPDMVFAPATPFPEGMAGIAYRIHSGKRVVMMDDVWEHTDRRGPLTKAIKRLIHKNIDAVFIPASSHQPYYIKMGFPQERAIFGVYTVDNDYFSKKAEEARQKRGELNQVMTLPENYFLYVGRFLPRKGLEILIHAYKDYKQHLHEKAWELVLVGGGDFLEHVRDQCKGVTGIHFVGPQFGDDLCRYYGLANVMIVPSLIDQWGLVVNEAMASSLPVIVSNGCGSAKTLVRESENGWVFEFGNVKELSRLMVRISMLTSQTLERMGRRSREIINEWSLDRFAEGVLQAIKIPRRSRAGFASNMISRFWKGHIRIN